MAPPRPESHLNTGNMSVPGPSLKTHSQYQCLDLCFPSVHYECLIFLEKIQRCDRKTKQGEALTSPLRDVSSTKKRPSRRLQETKAAVISRYSGALALIAKARRGGRKQITSCWSLDWTVGDGSDIDGSGRHGGTVNAANLLQHH